MMSQKINVDGVDYEVDDLTATGSIDQIKLAVQGLMTKAGMTNQPPPEIPTR